VLKVRRKEPIIWTIVGKKGRALDDIGPNKEGFVIVEGEYWLAVSDEEIKKDEAIIVVAKEDHKLRVRKA
jgi:membrane-bound serine protease (ClpP class)